MSDGLVEAQALLSNVRARLQDLRQPDTPAQYDSEVGGLLESVCELRQQMAGLQKRLSGYSRQP